MKDTRKDKRFGNLYMLMVQHKDSDFIPFFVSDEFGSLTSNSLMAKTFTQGKEMSDARSKFNNDYIFTKILITHNK